MTKNINLKLLARRSKPPMPKDIKEMVAGTLANLPERKKAMIRFDYRRRKVALAAVAALLIFVLLPNTSADIACAMQTIPFVGKLFKVVTVREYEIMSQNQELQINQPWIENEVHSAGIDEVNKDAEMYVNQIMQQFCKDTDKKTTENHIAVNVTYDVVTDTDAWFTMRICVSEAVASSDTYYKYYHIDKRTGELVRFADLFQEDTQYIDVVKNEILKQMMRKMKESEDNVYWLDTVGQEWDFTGIEDGWNFYFTGTGDITIVFDKYVVGPGQMGCPEFTINYTLFQEYLERRK